jgi:hypothetical protein
MTTATAESRKAFILDRFITTREVAACEMAKFSRMLRKELQSCSEIEAFNVMRCKPFGSIYLQTTLAYDAHIARESAGMVNAMEECANRALSAFAA